MTIKLPVKITEPIRQHDVDAVQAFARRNHLDELDAADLFTSLLGGLQVRETVGHIEVEQ